MAVNNYKDLVLAHYMGATTVKEDSLNPLMVKWYSPNFLPLHNKMHSSYTMKFRSDWNWLMPVVNKLCLDMVGIEDKDVIVDECYIEIIKKQIKFNKMNPTLAKLGKDMLKNLLNDCTEPQQMMFKRMYCHKNLDASIEEAVDQMDESKIDHAITQCERTVAKNLGI